MKIKQFLLNGELYSIDQTITLSELIKYFNYHDLLFVLELNKMICNKNNWNNIVVNNQDQIEIITIVGGG